ncbi:hypothetical protein BANT918_03318 [Brevibacterium antiquum CNRZ 918]|uniref:Uncharacterized protein n=1 Tax=Brevibacterium antiquum CNRZ 918 TaxID=1255637 RepID=A0A2H1KZW2_9MICO|nr:hypothetical protein BANT918_03318 [Brevibacterium antiquum CNRZ 918]
MLKRLECLVPGSRQGLRTLQSHRISETIIHVGRGVEPDPGVLVIVYRSTNPLMKARASGREAKRFGNAGPYFNDLKSASPYGLSLLTRGLD